MANGAPHRLQSSSRPRPPPPPSRTQLPRDSRRGRAAPPTTPRSTSASLPCAAALRAAFSTLTPAQRQIRSVRVGEAVSERSSVATSNGSIPTATR